MMESEIINSRAKKYLIAVGIVFLIILAVFGTVDIEMRFFQLTTLLLLIASFNIGFKCRKIKHILWLSFFFQVIMLIYMSTLVDVEVVADRDIYDKTCRLMLTKDNLKDAIGVLLNKEYDEYVDISDLGYTLPLYFCYVLFGINGGTLVMGAVKLICHLLSCILIYRIFRKFIGEKNALFVSLFWGINLYITYSILVGLKEAIFCVFVLWGVDRLYRQIKHPSVINFSYFLFVSLLTVFFRLVFPIFFILSYFGYALLFYIKNRFVKISLLLFFIGISLMVIFRVFSNSFDTILMQFEFDEEFTKMPIPLKILNAFISPYPNFRADGQNMSQLTNGYSVLHTTFAYFSIMGIIHVLKNKKSILYPILFIFFMNSLLLIITGFSMNVRFLYPTFMMYYVFMPYGISFFFKVRYYIPYLLLVIAIVMKYNAVF